MDSKRPVLKNTSVSAPLWQRYLWIALLLAISFFLYQKTAGFDFVNWDDPLHVAENASIRSWDFENIKIWFTKPAISLYIPLPLASFAADYLFYGLNPSGYHQTSLFLHLLNTLLVFFLLRHFFKEDGAAFLGALLFAAHPLQAETVAWISQRKTLLCATFSLSAVLWFCKANRARASFWPLLLLFFSAALLSKPTAVVLPVLFLAHYYFFAGSAIRGKGFLLWAPALAVLVLTLPLYAKFLPFYQNRGAGELLFYPLLHAGIYFKNALFPASLQLFYRLENFSSVQAAAFSVLGLTVLAAALAGAWKKKSFSFWLLWIWIWLLPVIMLLAVPVADHHFYLPLVGLAGFLLAVREKSRRIVTAVLILINFACLPATSRQLDVWRNSETLWKWAIVHHSDYWANLHLAEHYRAGGRVAEAVQANEQLISRWPGIADAYVNLGNFYLSLGETAKALELGERMREQMPHHAYGHVLRGLAFQTSGDAGQAETEFRLARELSPEDRWVLISSGRFYLQQNRLEEARGFFEQAAKKHSDSEAYYSWGLTENALQNWGAAAGVFREMRSKKLFFPGAYFQEGYASLKVGRRAEAKKFYLKSTKTDPGKHEAFLHLGLMSYQDRKLPEALRYFEETLRIKPDDAQALSFTKKIKKEMAS